MVAENAVRYPELLVRVKADGHRLGNHTYHHLRGCRVDTPTYLADVVKAEEVLNTKLFRPPHGRMCWSQKKAILKAGYRIFLWDVLTHDYSACYTVEKMLNIVQRCTRNGSIIVMHDSLKSRDRIIHALPLMIEWLHSKGYELRTLIS
jgi:peptidoglycan/xylan/chitin deacetylase (PgdA/CDA1 family)